MGAEAGGPPLALGLALEGKSSPKRTSGAADFKKGGARVRQKESPNKLVARIGEIYPYKGGKGPGSDAAGGRGSFRPEILSLVSVGMDTGYPNLPV